MWKIVLFINMYIAHTNASSGNDRPRCRGKIAEVAASPIFVD